MPIEVAVMTPNELKTLTAAVQYNCHVSDARHGGDYSLCVYLMKMREYYRWEQKLPYGAPLGKDAVGDWLQAREQLWEGLEDADLRPLSIRGRDYDPFDADAINDSLGEEGLVYSSGLGNRAKPHFFLGRLEQRVSRANCTVYVAAGEYARDLAAPPAMTLGDSIFLRRESLRRMLWEKLESWRWNRPDNALGRAFACYDFDADLEGALDAMTDREIDNALLHEQGEYEAGRLLDDAAWNAMLADVVGTPAELAARAVRDHLADALVTLPRLAEQADAPALHFYVGNLNNMRKHLFPGLTTAYDAWRTGGDTEPLASVAETGRTHWLALGREMLARHQAGAAGGDLVGDLRGLAEARAL
ncbi:Sfum_1244 family protein [uncultured Thiohalocapsa sp.]|uniref:Sfum_1244 family protein n=1 Tax=uncultured Thiohalocapsa sp. TaxID=768990 RepID=UPI0025DFCEE7|nr:Sfum_1244 family protein [uncultured Thiohalocapsa sp.]